MGSKRLRTIVYVDGFNFYYGQLKGTPWKWLDLPLLFEQVLDPQNHIIKVKYFTARVQPTAANPQISNRQDVYLRSLRRYCEKVEICLGHYLRHEVWMENAEPPPPKTKVWKNEEKGSDVNLALQVLNDAWLNLYDCAVIVSNDLNRYRSRRIFTASRRAAAQIEMTNSNPDGACLPAEQLSADQRVFMVSARQCQELIDLMKQPEQVNDGLRDLFSRKSPWDEK